MAQQADDLAVRIAQCIADADARGLHTVAAHLDSALVELCGRGVWPATSLGMESARS